MLAPSANMICSHSIVLGVDSKSGVTVGYA